MVSDFQDWDSFFSAGLGSEPEFTFAELERKLGITLPSAAYIHPMWWRSAENAPWQAHGWKAYPNVRKRLVRFEKTKAIPVVSERPASDDTVKKVLSSEPRLILVGGVSGKRDVSSPAKDLYRSVLWAKRVAYVEATGRPWMILSSEYGLIHPDTLIQPYDTSLSDQSPAYRQAWSKNVASEVVELCAAQGIETLEVHAGADQMLNGLVEHLNAAGLVVSWPLRGRRIGEQLSWYSLAVGAMESLSPELEASDSSAGTNRVQEQAPSSDPGDVQDGSNEEGSPALAESPRSVVVVASVFSALGESARSLRRRFQKWRSLVSAEITRRSGPAEGDTVKTLSLSSRLKLAESLAHFAESRSILEDLVRDPWTGNEDADDLLRANPFAFLVGILVNQGSGHEEAWDTPWVLQSRIGPLEPHLLLDKNEELVAAVEGPPAIHRNPAKIAEAITQAARTVVEDYHGNAAKLWEEATDPRELRNKLEAFKGIGPRQSARAVVVLQRRLGIRFAGSERGSLAHEADLRRVMLRSGLADYDDIEHMTMSMSELYPDDPGNLDPALLAIGSLWCHPVDPECGACAIGDHCPKIIESGGGVPQTGKAQTSRRRKQRTVTPVRSPTGTGDRDPDRYSF